MRVHSYRVTYLLPSSVLLEHLRLKQPPVTLCACSTPEGNRLCNINSNVASSRYLHVVLTLTLTSAYTPRVCCSGHDVTDDKLIRMMAMARGYCLDVIWIRVQFTWLHGSHPHCTRQR